MCKLGLRKARRVPGCGENLGRVQSEEQRVGGDEAGKVSRDRAGKDFHRSPSLSSLQTTNRYSPKSQGLSVPKHVIPWEGYT